MPLALMGVPGPVVDAPLCFLEDDAEANGDEFIGSLRLMLPTYLDERIPTVAEIAEMARTASGAFSANFRSPALPTRTCSRPPDTKKRRNSYAPRTSRSSRWRLPPAMPTQRISHAHSAGCPASRRVDFAMKRRSDAYMERPGR